MKVKTKSVTSTTFHVKLNDQEALILAQALNLIVDWLSLKEEVRDFIDALHTELTQASDRGFDSRPILI